MTRPASLPILFLALSAACAAPTVQERHERGLVAAWDFEPGTGGPLADKAPGGKHDDVLEYLGLQVLDDGTARISSEHTGGFIAEHSPDLRLTGPFTIWVRLRVHGEASEAAPVVRKAAGERYGFGLEIEADRGRAGRYAVGGGLAYGNAADTRLHTGDVRETLPIGAWREVALVVRPERSGLVGRIFAATHPQVTRAEQWRLADGPLRLPARRKPVALKAPLLIAASGADDPSPVEWELDELRVYARALTPSELAAIEPGSLGAEPPAVEPESELEEQPAEHELIRRYGTRFV